MVMGIFLLTSKDLFEQKIVSDVIEVMNQNDKNDVLQALQKSCENTSSPRYEIHWPTSFDTPSKDSSKKNTSSSKNTFSIIKGKGKRKLF